ncbi:uncharacterized protein LOC125225316 isoform X1 [Leguminivora glycinivorella]|uniref:uncharacterized protein LOC125225316 isoform X1 n=1 Tax=Leguminivora glycinivorella TaxID=1035111 RepID=UPI0020100265|nr:uncharacterized protein LOC125225316 isoform X1 [Leguminivora glycinivorella]
MTRLALILAVVTVANITVSQVVAQSFGKSSLHKLFNDDDDMDDDNPSSLTDRGLNSILELAVRASEKYGKSNADRMKTNRKKIKKYQPTLFDRLTGMDDNDVLVYDPESYAPVHTEKKNNRISELFGAHTDYNLDAVTDDEDDDSTVYVLVRKDDIRKRKTDGSSNNALSSLLNLLSSNQKDRSNIDQDRRYKGFRLRDLSYRRARDSSETYSSPEVVEKRPISRVRAYGGGRTPIPYIKNRGDIFEKDN